MIGKLLQRAVELAIDIKKSLDGRTEESPRPENPQPEAAAAPQPAVSAPEPAPVPPVVEDTELSLLSPCQSHGGTCISGLQI